MITLGVFVGYSNKDLASSNTNEFNHIINHPVVHNEEVTDIQNIEITSSSSTPALIDHSREDAIQKIENLLNKYSSPMRGYGNIIYDQSVTCGGDYKILMAIAGNESGFGRIPYKKYNPYGYLDGVYYSGWNDSLTKLSCVISKRFISSCNKDLNCIINKYGGSDTNKSKWISNINYFINQLN